MADEDVIRNIVRDVIRQVFSESKAAPFSENDQAPSAYYSPWTSVEYEAHPSRQQFNINEAAIGVGNISELLEFLGSQRCSIEKEKPCDHCGMCRNLGF